ncbi:MAG: hypothetical protein V3R41_00010 [Gammaproteobacteria bacterium]
MIIVRIGLDLAKTTFSLCGVDEHEHIVLELRGARLFARPVLERLVMLIFAHVDNDIVSDIRKVTNGNYALGNDHFKNEIDQMQTTTRFWITII